MIEQARCLESTNDNSNCSRLELVRVQVMLELESVGRVTRISWLEGTPFFPPPSCLGNQQTCHEERREVKAVSIQNTSNTGGRHS